MATRYSGIQDIHYWGYETVSDGGVMHLKVSFKVPYVNLGFSKECDFWQSFNGTGGMPGVLTRLKEVVVKNAPLLNEEIHKQVGGKEVNWKWTVSPDSDTRYFSMQSCTPDLLLFSTVAEVQ